MVLAFTRATVPKCNAKPDCDELTSEWIVLLFLHSKRNALLPFIGERVRPDRRFFRLRSAPVNAKPAPLRARALDYHRGGPLVDDYVESELASNFLEGENTTDRLERKVFFQ